MTYSPTLTSEAAVRLFTGVTTAEISSANMTDYIILTAESQVNYELASAETTIKQKGALYLSCHFVLIALSGGINKTQAGDVSADISDNQFIKMYNDLLIDPKVHPSFEKVFGV